MKTSLLRAWNLLSLSEKLQMQGFALMRVLLQGLEVGGLALLGLFMSLVAGTDPTRDLPAVMSLPLVSQLLASPEAVLILVLVLFFLRATASTSWNWLFGRKFLASLEKLNSARVLEAIFANSIANFRKSTHAENVWAAGPSCHAAFALQFYYAISVVGEVFLAVTILGLMFWYDAGTAVVMVVFFGTLIGLFQLHSQRKLREVGEEIAIGSINFSNVLGDARAIFPELIIYGKRQSFLSKAMVPRTDYAIAQAMMRFYSSLPKSVAELALMIGGLGILARYVMEGNLVENLPALGVFIAGSGRLIAAVVPLQSQIFAWKTASPQAEACLAIMEDFNANSRSDEVAGPIPSSVQTILGDDGPVQVIISKLSFRHVDSEAPLLSDISARVEPGQLCLIRGNSGAGKSTLGNLILGLLEPTDGFIEIHGQTPHLFRRVRPGRVSFVPQFPQCIEGSLFENVSFSSRNASSAETLRAQTALSLAGLGGFCESLPDGLNTELGPKGPSLSGGQLQRLGIARALYLLPRLIVLDEPTSSLDERNEALIAQTLEDIKGKVTIIVISHSSRFDGLADCVVQV